MAALFSLSQRKRYPYQRRGGSRVRRGLALPARSSPFPIVVIVERVRG